MLAKIVTGAVPRSCPRTGETPIATTAMNPAEIATRVRIDRMLSEMAPKRNAGERLR